MAGGIASRTCGLTEPALADGDVPEGATAFFLVTGVGPTGQESELGHGRPNTSPCP
jgi:hypothetical protein